MSKKRTKPKKKQDVMMPNLSGVKFEDAIKALLKTPMPPADESRVQFFKKNKKS